MDELLALLRQESHLHTGYESTGLFPLHARARLRCSPQAVSELMKLITPGNFINDPASSTIWGIVVTVDATMEPGTWQLIAGEGTV